MTVQFTEQDTCTQRQKHSKMQTGWFPHGLVPVLFAGIVQSLARNSVSSYCRNLDLHALEAAAG